MRYLQDLGVKLDEPTVLTILTELKAPTMGEFTRDGFIDGWTNLRLGRFQLFHLLRTTWKSHIDTIDVMQGR